MTKENLPAFVQKRLEELSAQASVTEENSERWIRLDQEIRWIKLCCVNTRIEYANVQRRRDLIASHVGYDVLMGVKNECHDLFQDQFTWLGSLMVMMHTQNKAPG